MCFCASIKPRLVRFFATFPFLSLFSARRRRRMMLSLPPPLHPHDGFSIRVGISKKGAFRFYSLVPRATLLAFSKTQPGPCPLPHLPRRQQHFPSLIAFGRSGGVHLVDDPRHVGFWQYALSALRTRHTHTFVREAPLCPIHFSATPLRLPKEMGDEGSRHEQFAGVLRTLSPVPVRTQNSSLSAEAVVASMVFTSTFTASFRASSTLMDSS